MAWPGLTYRVVVVFPDGNPEVASYWPSLDEAFMEAEKVRAQLKVGGGRFFVGVMDGDDPERGWLQPDEQEETDHGQTHWVAVEQNARRLAALTPDADVVVAVLFARFHDRFRENEYFDPEHGLRAAAYVRTADLGLTPEQVETLAFACEHHDQGTTSSDPTVGVCWDADRLDLPRVGIVPNARYLSTAAGKSETATE